MSALRVTAGIAAVVGLGAGALVACDDDSPSSPPPSGSTTPFVEPGVTSASAPEVVNQNPSNPIGNTPGAGSG